MARRAGRGARFDALGDERMRLAREASRERREQRKRVATWQDGQAVSVEGASARAVREARLQSNGGLVCNGVLRVSGKGQRKRAKSREKGGAIGIYPPMRTSQRFF